MRVHDYDVYEPAYAQKGDISLLVWLKMHVQKCKNTNNKDTSVKPCGVTPKWCFFACDVSGSTRMQNFALYNGIPKNAVDKHILNWSLNKTRGVSS